MAFASSVGMANTFSMAFSLDCYDREALSWVCSTRGIDGALIRDLIVQSVEYRFGACRVLKSPIQWLSDNGPGYTANETVKFLKKPRL